MEIIFMDNDYYFYSKLTNKKYCAISSIDLKLFENELKDNNMTIEEYCEKFLKNIAHEKHLNKSLKEDELYVIKNIKLVKGTYEKIIVNKQFKCEICKNFFAASKPSFVSHIKRFHKIDSLSSYFKQIGYEEINPKYELCNFCKKNEIPKAEPIASKSMPLCGTIIIFFASNALFSMLTFKFLISIICFLLIYFLLNPKS